MLKTKKNITKRHSFDTLTSHHLIILFFMPKSLKNKNKKNLLKKKTIMLISPKLSI